MHKFIFSICLIFLTACSAKPRYYKSVKGDPFNLDYAVVGIDVFIETASNSSKPKTALELKDEGQAALIEKATDLSAAQAALAAPIKAAAKPITNDTSLINFSRKLDFTIVAKGLAPADRVKNADVSALLNNTDWEFKSWKGFAAKKTDVKVAQVTRAVATDFKGEGGLSLPGIEQISDIGVSGGVSTETSAVQELQFKVVEFIPQLNQQKASFYMSAPFPQFNLAGGYTVVVNMTANKSATKIAPFLGLSTKQGEEGARLITTHYMTTARDLNLELRMPYELRHVAGNAHTIEERDDKVEILYRPENRRTDIYTIPVTTTTATVYAGDEQEFPRVGRTLIESSDIQAEATILFVGRSSRNLRPLKLFLPAINDQPRNSYCIAAQDGRDLWSFLLWLRANPTSRLNFTQPNGQSFEAYIDDPAAANGIRRATAADLSEAQVRLYPLNFTLPGGATPTVPTTCPGF